MKENQWQMKALGAKECTDAKGVANGSLMGEGVGCVYAVVSILDQTFTLGQFGVDRN